MTAHQHFARELRLRRLFHHHPSRLVVVPLDHSISDGPLLPPGDSLDTLAGLLAAADVDAIVVHKGGLRHLRPSLLSAMSVIVHLSASTAQAPDPDAKCLVTGVEEALRLGADAVSVHVNLGSREESRQVADLGHVADLCDRWNLPLLAMMYARGPAVSDPGDPGLVAHAATVAADLGADLVKVPHVGSVRNLATITATCPVPLLIAGGPARTTPTEIDEFVRDVVLGGAAGVAVGRTIFQAADPAATASRVTAIVHDRLDDPAGGTSEHSEAVLA